MANITTQNNIRYQIDTLSTKTQGVLVSAADTLNFTRATQISGITVNGVQPSGTTRHIAFLINNQWGRINSSGGFEAFTQNNTGYSNLEEHANTPSELEDLTDIPALAGKTCGIAIALSTTDPQNARPTCGIIFSCCNSVQQLEAVEYSPTYTTGANGQVMSITASTSQTNGGSVSVDARGTRPDGTDTGWQSVDKFSGEKVSDVQFRGTYKAQTLGVSTAKIDNVIMIYSDGQTVMSGMNDGDIITLTEDWYMPVRSCRLTVKHSPLEQSTMKAYIAFRKTPSQIHGETLGVGSGGRKTFQLAHKGGLKYDTLKLYYDNVRAYTDYEFNCEAGRVTCTAPEGVIVSCDYEYGWEDEVWEEMTHSSLLSYSDYDQSEYRYSRNTEGLSVCALKIVLGMTSGRITGERLGTASGTSQSFRLARRVNDGKITLYAGGLVLSAKNWMMLEDPQYVSLSAAAGRTITADYEWISETPKVYEYYAVYSE